MLLQKELDVHGIQFQPERDVTSGSVVLLPAAGVHLSYHLQIGDEDAGKDLAQPFEQPGNYELRVISKSEVGS